MDRGRIEAAALLAWVAAALALYLWQFRPLAGPVFEALGLG
jgi:hypothetical protein